MFLVHDDQREPGHWGEYRQSGSNDEACLTRSRPDPGLGTREVCHAAVQTCLRSLREGHPHTLFECGGKSNLRHEEKDLGIRLALP
jgi:hypothetical protein